MLRAELEASLGELRIEAALTVEPDRCLAIVGPSGAGKSSLLRMVAGLVRPRRGLVACESEVWLDTEAGIELAPERRRCGSVFQDYAQRSVPRSMRQRTAVALLERFGVGRLAEARPATLSGGERQRVALARALGSAPRALLLDEPLSALDASTRAHASRQLLELMAEAGVPTLLVTHDFDEAASIADEVAVLEAGRIVQRGTAEELASRPASAFVADLIGSVVLGGRAEHRVGGVTRIALDGGGTAFSTDLAESGTVVISIHPWEITLEPGPASTSTSARNHLRGRITSVRSVGNRVRVGIDCGQPLVAEVTPEAREELGLVPGQPVVASWKATATRIVSAGGG